MREVNAELCKLICYLEPPDGVTKTLALLAKAPTQEEQIEYALSLRTVKTGWTTKQHEEYFNWFHKAANYRGGNSFHGFLRNIRNDAIKSLYRSREDRAQDRHRQRAAADRAEVHLQEAADSSRNTPWTNWCRSSRRG